MAADTGATEGWRKRRGGGFTRAAAVAAPVVRKAGAARGFAEQRLLSAWAEVVGPELAAICRPAGVSYRGRDAGLGATLTVAVSGAFAPEVEHQLPRLIERVNQVYGYRAIARARVTQGAAPPEAPRPAPPPAPPEPLDAAADPDIRTVADPGLRAALAMLGANIRRAGLKRADSQGHRR